MPNLPLGIYSLDGAVVFDAQAMTSAELNDGGRLVELIVCDAAAPDAASGGVNAAASEEITPLLTQTSKPKFNIFSSVSYTRRKSSEQVIKPLESDTSALISLVWSGSRYSGLLCMVASSAIFFMMEAVSDAFSAQPIPLFETIFTRCTIILVLTFLLLKRSREPILEPRQTRKFLLLRALLGYISVMGFVYSIQRLPLSQAIVLNFTTPIMAAMAARIILHEKLKIGDIGGLACSFSGVLFIFQQTLITQGKAGKLDILYAKGSHHIYALLVGVFSAITGGISYCLIRAAAKDSGQPLSSLFAFSLLASPAAGICMLSFENIVLPSLYSLFLMVVLGVLAFFAELFLARALQLEKTSKAANIQFLEVALIQIWEIGLRRTAASFGNLVGCLLIFISVGYTIYDGPETG